jgi:hypothetical protein
MCECASHVHFRTPIHVLNVLWEAHCPKWHSYANWHVQRCEILPRQWRQYYLWNYHVPKFVHTCVLHTAI